MTDFNFENPTEPPTLSMAPVPVQYPSFGAADASEQFGALAGQAAAPDEFSGFGRLFTASRKATEVDGVAQGKLNALYDAANKRNADIKAATGEDLGNPYLAVPLTGTELDDPYAAPHDKAALAAYAKENPNYTPGQIIDAQGQERIKQLRLSNYQSDLERLQAKYPDQTTTIAANKPLIDDARTLTASTLAEQAAAKQAASGVVAPYIAQFAGSLTGAFRDPQQAAALMVAGPELQAVKSLRWGGEILARMIGDGFLNAGIAASSQPEVQQWRAERGQENGVVPALQDVGMNFLFGAAIGGVAGAAHMALKPADVDLVNRAMAGDMNAAREVAAILPKEHAPDLHAYLEADGHDAAATDDHPDTHVSTAELERSYQQAIRHHEDPSEPLPELLPTIDRRHTDTAARDAIEANPDQSPLDVLRNDPDLARSALVSDDPGLQKAGRLASMGDDAFDMVRNGEVGPDVAAEVAARVNQPDEQAAILRQVAQDRGVTPQRAAQAVSEIMDQRALPESLTRLLGTDGARFQEVPAIDYSNRSVTARMFADEVRGDLGTDVPGTLVSTFLHNGEEVHGIPAYHGTPHEFDRFDIGKIGTGEGAQAYGHGLYFAERRGIGEQYRDALGRNRPYRQVKGGAPLPTWVANNIEASPAFARDAALRAKAEFEGRIAEFQRQLDSGESSQPWNIESNIAGLKDIVSTLDKLARGEAELSAPGHLYTVRIARDPEHFLDWDKPLSEQSEYVKERLAKLTPDLPDRVEQLPNGRWRPMLGDHGFGPPDGFSTERGAQQQMDVFLRNHQNAVGSEIYRRIVGSSSAMSDAGIAGIKYHDAGSRSVGEGTRNYVVFNDRDIHITHKNDVPVAREQPLPDFLKAEAKAQFIEELKTAGIRSKDFDADLTQRATALLDKGERLDHATAFEQAAVERLAEQHPDIWLEARFGDEAQWRSTSESLPDAIYESIFRDQSPNEAAAFGSGAELRGTGETGGLAEPASAKPQSLLAFLRAAGGIKDYRGELRGREYHRTYPGLINNKKGLPLDRAREAAAEAGYLGHDTERAMAETDVNDLLNALEDAHNTFSAHDGEQLVRWQAHQAALAEAELGAGQGRPRPASGAGTDEPTFEPGAENLPQGVIPGTERIGQGELAQRRANEGLKPSVAQKDAEGLALFGDARNQTDLLDLVRQEEAAPAPERLEFLADLIDACKV
jgi:hypothetical protein